MPFTVNKYKTENPIKAFLYLVKNLGYSQKEAQRLISKGKLLVNGKPLTKTGAILDGSFELIEFKPATKGLKPIVEEEHFVAYDKPSGVLIHPQNRYTDYSLVDELRYRFGKQANITHRIDQETSGIVLCAKSKQAEIEIKQLFENREIQKSYLAFVHGKMSKEVLIDAPLLRQKHLDTNIRTIVVVNEKGKSSQTLVKPLRYFPDLNMTLVEARPHTGRQHQIRVHLFHVKHPIVGDPLYGQTFENMMKYFDRKLDQKERLLNTGSKRLLLHANELSFTLYEKKYQLQSKANFVSEALEHIQEMFHVKQSFHSQCE